MKPEILRNGNIRISIPVTFRTQGGRKRIAAKETTDLPGCDSPLLLNLARGFHWQALIDDGTYANIKALAEAIGIDSGVGAKATRLRCFRRKSSTSSFSAKRTSPCSPFGTVSLWSGRSRRVSC